MEPIVIEDVPSSMIEEGMNPRFENSFSSTIPIIEDVETPTKTPTETPAETPAGTSVETPIEIKDETSTRELTDTCMKMKPTQFLRKPPYPE